MVERMRLKEVMAERFAAQDFAVFEVDGFAARMPLLRAQITPKLMVLGEALTKPLAEIVGEPLFPHVARHLRRTVNAPEETWVAFAREKRAYKPYVHLRVAVSAKGLRVTVFCEDYADDKALFAKNLAARAESLAALCADHSEIVAYDIKDNDRSSKSIRAFAQNVNRIKSQHAVFGIPFEKKCPELASADALVPAILSAAKTLLPLYECGKHS